MKVILTYNLFMFEILVIYFVVSKIIDRYNNIKVDITKRIRNVNVTFHCERQAVNFIKGNLKLIPAYVLNKFDKEGYAIHVLSREAFEATNPGDNVIGYFWPYGKLIVILFDKNSKTSEYYHLADTVCHEFGHFIDHCYPMTERISPEGNLITEYLASERQDLLDVFEDAKYLHADDIGSYYLSSSSEFFAYLSSKFFTKSDFVEKRHKEVFKKALATTFERAK